MIPPSELIRDARRRAGLTQAELARRLGVTQGAIAQWERRGSNPRVETLADVLHATGHRLELAAVPHRGNVDETLIAGNLRMSPAERLAAFESSYRGMKRIADRARAA